MNPPSLEPIPTPVAERWKDFRIQVVPVIVFCLAAFFVSRIWRHQLVAPQAVGQFEAVQAQVTSPQPGRLYALNVRRYQIVKQGDLIGSLAPVDARFDLDALQAKLELIRLRIQPETPQQRGISNYERMYLEVMLEKSKLASTKVRLQLATDDAKRSEQLFKENLISKADLDRAQSQRTQLETEVAQLTETLNLVEPGLEKLRSLADASKQSVNFNSLSNSLDVLDQSLSQILARSAIVELRAPLGGMVSTVYRNQGEHVRDGDLILTISATHTGRIQSYTAFPFSQQPVVGMEVEIRRRNGRQETGRGRIESVGAQVEPIPSALLVGRANLAANLLGLSFAVTAPIDMKAFPGEIVDIVFASDSPGTPANSKSGNGP